MKYIDFKRYKFSTIQKKINTLRDNFSEFFNILDLQKIYKYFYTKIINFINILVSFKIKKIHFRILKKINIFKNNFFILHLPLAIIFFGFLYIFIPIFYNYDVSGLKNNLCINNNLECVIRGKVKYTFYPTPRLIVKDIIVNTTTDKKKTLLTSESVEIKLSIKNLLDKKKHKIKKIKLKNFIANLYIDDLKKYDTLYKVNKNFIPIQFNNGQILFYDKNNYITAVKETNVKFKFIDNSKSIKLKGNFLGDKILLDLKNENLDNKNTTDLIIKMSNLNFLTKATFFEVEKDKKIFSGNALIKKGKNTITSLFKYENGELIINKSNLRNNFIDGKLEGNIKLFPYFIFNLSVDLNSISFTKLYSYFLNINDDSKKKIFNLNNKINGKLNLTTNKIYSSNNLIKSFESRLNFKNGSIFIEQFLFNLGKLGAADFIGSIDSDKKNTNLRFESNVFVDNQKKFLSKFGIYNKKDIPSSFFISGNFDFDGKKILLYEISDEKKLTTEDIDYIQREFNDLMLEDGYENLFNFSKFKKFIKSITGEEK